VDTNEEETRVNWEKRFSLFYRSKYDLFQCYLFPKICVEDIHKYCFLDVWFNHFCWKILQMKINRKLTFCVSMLYL